MSIYRVPILTAIIIFRCEALNFMISKSQKKILKRMAKFLRNELSNDNVTVRSEDQRDNIGEILTIIILIDLFNKNTLTREKNIL